MARHKPKKPTDISIGFKNLAEAAKTDPELRHRIVTTFFKRFGKSEDIIKEINEQNKSRSNCR